MRITWGLSKPIFEIATGVPATLTRRHYSGGYCHGIRCCKSEARKLFHDVLGFPIGDKCKSVRIPRLILQDSSLWADYVRGVFDTDGCIYTTRTGKGNARHPVVNIGSSSSRHRLEIRSLLVELGFSCWLVKEGVSVSGWSTVDRFFRVIRPNNPKHLSRFQRFYAGRGSQAWHGDG